MRKDKITEFEFGEGAIRLPFKCIVQEASNERTLVCGVALEVLLSRETQDLDVRLTDGTEMWEGEIILIPRRKYTRYEAGETMVGLRIDQKLRTLWSQAKYWKKKIFDKSEGVK